jgi:CBS domain-containing protein
VDNTEIMSIQPATHTGLGSVRVADCMHHGIVSCDPSTPAREVAAVMAQNRVHAVALTDRSARRPIGIVTALDVAAAAASGEELTAERIAATEFVSVSANQPVQRAAQLMSEHGISHLIVLDPASGVPIGVLSTLDVASVYAT